MLPSLLGGARITLVALTLLGASSSAAAQPPEQGRLGGKAALSTRRPPPSLLPPLYYMLAPGAVLLIVGGVLWTQDDPTEEDPALYNASVGLMGSGATMVVGSVPYLGARIGKRRRWAAQRRWEACGRDCKFREPRLYHAAYMLVPGLLMTVAGGWFLLHNWYLEESAGTLPEDPPGGYGEPYVTLASACAVVGTTLVVAGTVHLVARTQRRAAWRKRNDALSRMQLQPRISMRPGSAASYGFGLSMSTRF